MADQSPPAAPLMDLATLQRWTATIGEAQQMMLEFWAKQAQAGKTALAPPAGVLSAWGDIAHGWVEDSQKLAARQADFWLKSVELWNRFLTAPAAPDQAAAPADKDRRFASPAWRGHPFFDLIRQSYALVSDTLLGSVEDIESLNPEQRQKLRFATQQLVDAMSPANFPLTNPEVIEATVASEGKNLVAGLEHMLADISKGQLTQARSDAFEVGRNLAATPGKVVFETPLFQLIHYTPATETVLAHPLIIFPPWINRFYILDLSPEKSFIKWAVDQGISTFVISWKSADESLKDVVLDDYVAAQIQAIDTVRDLLGVKSVHVVGYCVAGTTLAVTLALLAARGEANKVKSATFFTAQVDFTDAGDLKLFVDDAQLDLISALSADTGYLDGRYMAATFNLLRGRDLIWNYVVNNYLLGKDYAPFDLLYWNSDTTNLPAKWHRQYLEQLYRHNLLVKPGGITVAGTAIDIDKVKIPSYVQAGREDHIAPPQSVWKLTEHFTGPLRFVLAGSGHIAGVVNPPAAGKYQYWTNDRPAANLDEFLKGAAETKGSWWPDWLSWLKAQSAKTVKVEGARIPGQGKLKAIEDAPGRYVRMH